MSVQEIDLNIDFDSVSQKVINNQNHWIDRGCFYTLGAASYLDDKINYQDYITKYNGILKKEFGDLIDYLCDYFSAKTHPEIALPGFHVFDKRGNGLQASIHQDLSYKRLPIYSENYKNTKSFTILLQKPSCGAGLNFWDDDFKRHYCDYKLGHMYIHLGGLRHQIANKGKIRRGEYRITMQGHVVTFDDETYIYF